MILAILIYLILKNLTNTITKEWMVAIEIADDLNYATSDYRMKQFGHVISSTEQQFANYESEIVLEEEHINELLDAYEATIEDDYDAKKFAEALFTTAPFDKCKKDFNIWAVEVPSKDSGTDVSGKGVYKNTAFDSGFYTFGIDRYITTANMRAIRDAVWNVPCDGVFILVNSEIYGGGGMYNFYAIGTAHNPMTMKVFTHELGHSLFGLADEYYTSAVAYNEFYNLKVEPWEPNITTMVDFDSKWKDMLPKGTEIPTPANKENVTKLGVYEGGGYVAKGIYRPMINCMMRNNKDFCPACSRAILRMVEYLTDKRKVKND
jgi:hypothetical protein